jgi:hypothetical protein
MQKALHFATDPMKCSDPRLSVPKFKPPFPFRCVVIVLALCCLGFASSKDDKKKERQSPNALQVLVDLPIDEAVQATREVAGDGVIHGTLSYERERNLTGAHAAEASDAFGPAPSGGTVIYKIADSVLSPKDFKDSADMGSITVRYILTPFDAKNTNLRIDAVFIERTTKKIHDSDGSVEATEFGEIRHHVEQVQAKDALEKDEEARIAREREEKQAELDLATRQDAAVRTASGPLSADLEQRVADLRRKAELRVKASGTQLKSAPYKSAANIQVLAPYTDVVVLIVTPYWYGVQTEDGHHGWIYHGEVEKLP